MKQISKLVFKSGLVEMGCSVYGLIRFYKSTKKTFYSRRLLSLCMVIYIYNPAVHASSYSLAVYLKYVGMYIALRRFLHIEAISRQKERRPKPGLCPTLISSDFKGSL